MRILLYIPQQAFSTEVNQKLVTSINSCLNEHSAQYGIESVVVHTYSPKSLEGVGLIHIFGCWDHNAASLMTKATKACVPTVFSPLGGLEPWTMRGKVISRRIQTSLYQRRMARQASAVHVAGKFENEMLAKLKWTNRIAIIKNCVLTNLVTPEDMARQMVELYQKVFDSNACSLMSHRATEALSAMLHAAIYPALTAKPKALEDAMHIADSIDDTDWRNICLYAHDEHITDFVAKGAKLLKPSLSIIDTEGISRFKSKCELSDGDLKCDDVKSGNIMLKSKIEDITSDYGKNECEICLMALNIKYELAHNNLPLRHIVNIASRLFNDNYDEDALAAMLKATGAYTFMARLETSMQTIVRLTEGFMPISPINDKQAQKLTLLIAKLKNIL